MNIFYNEQEDRFRSGVRFLGFIFLAFALFIPSGFFDELWASALIIALGSVLLIPITARTLDKRSVTDFGLSLDKLWWKELGLGILIAFIAQSFIFITEYSFGWLEIIGFGWELPGIENWGFTAFTYFLLMISVGIYEEILFRAYPIKNFHEGFIFGRITPTSSAIIAVSVTSVLFGVAHFWNPNANLISTIYITLAGLMLGIPFLLTGRMAIPIGIHFAWNWVMGGIYGLPVSGLDGRRSVLQTTETGPDLWTGGRFGPEAGLLGLFGMAIIFVWIFWYAKSISGGKVQLHESFKKDYQPEQL